MGNIRILLRKPAKGKRLSSLCWVDRVSDPSKVIFGEMDVVFQELETEHVFTLHSGKPIPNNGAEIKFTWKDIPVIFEEETCTSSQESASESDKESKPQFPKSTLHLEHCDPLNCKCNDAKPRGAFGAFLHVLGMYKNITGFPKSTKHKL